MNSGDLGLPGVSVALGSLHSLDDVLRAIAEKARALVGAHQSAASVVIGGNWMQAIHAVSLSDKYAAWREYDERPDGTGIYRLVCELTRPMRLTQAELEAHPAWRGFGQAAGRHPPMRGWLAVPLTGRGGRNIGLIQLSDKHEGEFTEEDESILIELARRASVAMEHVRKLARASRRAQPGSGHPERAQAAKKGSIGAEPVP